MNAIPSRLARLERGAGVYPLCLATIILLAPVCSAPGADLRKAVRRVLPATVAVEWRSDDRDDRPPAEPVSTVDQLLKQDKPVSVSTLNELAKQGDPQAAALLERIDVPQKPDAVGLASGTVVSADGLIVTLIGETREGSYWVTFPKGREVPARLLVDDRRSGLQLLKVDKEDLRHVELGDEEAELGQQVVAVTCTHPKGRIVAQGIVAARDQRIPGLPCEVLQTDVRVGKMSAGAPLADVDGRLVGIVVAMKAHDAKDQGPAFAVPTDYVRLLLEARKGTEKTVVDRPRLGVGIGSPSEGDLPVVTAVIPDSPAATAGIREGDEIAKIDVHEVSTSNDVLRLLGRHRPGDQITVTIRRDGKSKEFEISLGRFETPTKTAARSFAKIEAVLPEGLNIVTLDDKDGKRLTLRKADREDLQESAVARALEWLSKNQNKYGSWHPVGTPNVTIPEPAAAPATIRVQRSDIEKKLDQLNSDVQSLRDQLQTLIEEVQKLQERLRDP